METDVVVVGGGPAGAAAALTLLRYSSLRVAVIERGGPARRRVGEHIGPAVVPLLDYLGLRPRFAAASHRRAFASAAAWGADEVAWREALLTGYGDAWHLDRDAFDRMLREAVVERGGDLLAGVRYGGAVRDVPGAWRVSAGPCGASAAPRTIRARYLIDASGRGSVAARALGSRREVLDSLVGIVGFFGLEAGAPLASHTLVESVPDGWWYSALLPGSELVVAFMTDAVIARGAGLHRAPAWLEHLSRARHTAGRVGARDRLADLVARPAGSSLLSPAAGEGWVAAGDAAAAFDPLSSMGIGHAISSGIHAARVAAAELSGGAASRHREAYVAGVRRNFEQFRSIRAATYAAERRWARRSFWAARHGRRAAVAAPRPARHDEPRLGRAGGG